MRAIKGLFLLVSVVLFGYMFFCPVLSYAQQTLDRSKWTIWVDSEETEGQDNRGINVKDGNALTIWHSKWTGTPSPLPHSLVVDLGEVVKVSGFKALPRTDLNGRIGTYELYVKTETPTKPPVLSEWTLVKSGTFPNTGVEQQVMFEPVSTQHVWLRSLSEAQGKNHPWTSLAEFNLIGVVPPKVLQTCDQFSSIAWNMENFDVDGYRIYRNASPITVKPATPAVELTEVAGKNPVIVSFPELPEGPTYFRVTAFKGSGAEFKESEMSNEAGCLYTKLVGIDVWRIVTPNEDKSLTGPYLSFKTNVASIVYVMYDTRNISQPEWLSTFTVTQETMSTSDGVMYQVYRKEVSSGTVELGGNASGTLNNMYGVAVVGKSPGLQVTEAKTTQSLRVVPFAVGKLMYSDSTFTIATSPNLLKPGLKLVIPKNLEIKE